MSKIPKIIHYCWFGKGEYTDLINKCINSWKKFMPEYEFILWNEERFNIETSNTYVKQAYKAKKYAFVSDYVRLHALYNYGGIYLDTDMEVLKSLDELLDNELFTGFESEEDIACGIIGCTKKNKIIKKFIDSYKDRIFIKGDGTLDTKTIVMGMNEICKNNGLKLNNTYQSINGLTVYPKTVFYPISYYDKKKHFSKDTYTIHHYCASWATKEDKIKSRKLRKYKKRKMFLCKFMSIRNAEILLDLKYIIKNKVKNIKGF